MWPWLALLALATLLRLAAAALIAPTPDEAYYWIWSRALAAGYLDHPPMVALWIRAGVALAGPGPLGLRLLGPLAAAAGTVLLWQAARDLGASRAAATQAAILLNATLLFGAGAVTMTPDTPLLFFWTAALWALARLIATGRARWWLAAGAACGLALCSKYTALLLPCGIVLWLAIARDQARDQARWLRHPAPWLGAVLAAGLFAPTMLWNARHGWASFAKQGGRGAVFHPAAALGHLGELAAGQAGLATPLVFLLVVLGVAAAARTALRTRAAAPVLLAAMTLPGAALFVEHALGDRVQANWPAILYPAACIAAGLAAPAARRLLFMPASALGAALTVIVYVQAIAAPLKLPARIDPTLRLAGYAALARDLQAEADREGASFVAADDYATAAELAWHAPGCRPLIGIEPRWSLFALPSGAAWMEGRTGLLVRSARRHTPPAPVGWASLQPAGTIVRGRGAQVAETYLLYKGVGLGHGAATALLPCRKAGSGPALAPPD